MGPKRKKAIASAYEQIEEAVVADAIRDRRESRNRPHIRA